MRHRKDGRQFSRDTSHRRAMFRNLAGNLINHERIVTTDAKAKELRRVAERLITKAKRLGEVAYTPQDKLDDAGKAKRLHVVRLLRAYLPKVGAAPGEKRGVDLVEKVLTNLSQRFATRNGGYTRIVKIGARRGDNANLSIIEFVDAKPIATGEAIVEDTAEEAPAAEEPAKDEAAEEKKAESDE
jgi:large subunit ribosomal protein L17